MRSRSGSLRDRRRQRLAHLGARHLQRRVVRVRILQRVDQRDGVAAGANRSSTARRARRPTSGRSAVRLSWNSSSVIPSAPAISSSVGRPVVLVLELDDRPLDLARAAAHRARHPVHRAQLVDDGALDAADRVGLELDVAARVVALDRIHQAEQPVGDQVALLDVRRQAGAQPAGHVLDQRRVRQDQSLAQMRVAHSACTGSRSEGRRRSCRGGVPARARLADAARLHGCIPGSCRPMRGRATPGCSADRHLLPADEWRRCAGARAAIAAGAPRGAAPAPGCGARPSRASGRPRTLTNNRSQSPSPASAVRPRSEIARQRGRGRPADGHDPLLVALAGHAQRPLVAVEVAQAAARRSRPRAARSRTSASSIARSRSARGPSGPAARLEQPPHLLLVERGRQLARRAWGPGRRPRGQPATLPRTKSQACSRRTADSLRADVAGA